MDSEVDCTGSLKLQTSLLSYSSYNYQTTKNCTHKKLAVDGLDHDLLWRVLADVEPELELLLALARVLDEGRRGQPAQPLAVVAQAAARQQVARVRRATEEGHVGLLGESGTNMASLVKLPIVPTSVYAADVSLLS